MSSYPLWLLLFLILPLGLIGAFEFRTLMKYRLALALTAIGCLVLAVPWDMLAVSVHIWYFSEPYILGLWLWGLPVEEYVYILFVGLLSASVTILVWERYGVRK
jgi:lycopene cyclase domain-containing protein